MRGREGGEGERGRNKKESVEQRGRQRKHGGRGLEDGEKDLRGTEAGKKRCRMSKFHEEKKKKDGDKERFDREGRFHADVWHKKNGK